MIQRIQTAFLLVATVFSFLMLTHPISSINLSNHAHLSFRPTGLSNFATPPTYYMHTWPVFILMVLTAAINLGTVFLFRKRVLQMRLCVYNILLTLGLSGLMFFYYFYIKHHEIIEGATFTSGRFSYTSILPFVNIILLFQAFRAIRRDELLVKSYDRLR